MIKVCPVMAGGYCLRRQCAWFNESRGFCGVLIIAQALEKMVAYDEDYLGMVHVRIQPSHPPVANQDGDTAGRRTQTSPAPTSHAAEENAPLAASGTRS